MTDYSWVKANLAFSGFKGDFENSLGAREVASTDNSIYQVRPDAIVYPRIATDINKIVQAAARNPAGPLPLRARGGNTGTNGQSLGGGLVVDFARYMTTILSVEETADGGRVRVQPGVVLDQLNAYLAEQGLFFPPMVSTASRATIGGMIATDASGKGSRKYGKTSDYIENLDVVLADGSDWKVEPMTRLQAERLASRPGIIGDIHRESLRVALENVEEIEATFPKMNRGLTGYNLQKLYDASNERLFLAPLLAGSEGTLALTKSVELRVIRKPAEKALALVRYGSVDAALRDVGRLLQEDPLAIEVVDDKVLGVAQDDIVWTDLEQTIGSVPGDTSVRAMSFIEYAGDADAVARWLPSFEARMSEPADAVLDWKIVRDPSTIAKLWTLREKSVGLLARLGSGRQGMPFVEDTAVPPEQLPDYVADFRALLDSYGLNYGMFGHADVGCLHVRPFLDMRDPDQAALIRPISDGVAALTKRYGGLLWGEHGRGYRGEYSPFFFGPTLYRELQALKKAFDPDNILNPGKLAAPTRELPIDRIDTVPMRGAYDRQITDELLADFDRSVACNGNGACFSWDSFDAMCPSYKATRDRAQSPKGRAALLRAWARLSSAEDESGELDQIENAVATSLGTCLSCKACTTLCPVKVDIPTMKSRFMARYYDSRPRPLRHQLLAMLEPLLGLGRAFPAIANGLASREFFARLLLRTGGMVDLPSFVPPTGRRAPIATAEAISRLDKNRLARTVVLVEDSFTSSFDGRLVDAATRVLERLSYHVFRLPPRANGKALHVLGLRSAFARLAKRRMEDCAALGATGVRLVGLDAATALMFEQEYREFSDAQVQVIGLDELLAKDLVDRRLRLGRPVAGPEYQLLGHCTEQALRPETPRRWAQVLAHFGVRAVPQRTGCCGMAGMFGHEAEHQEISAKLFDLSWRPQISANASILATGYSCRSQVKRFSGFRPDHPIEVIDQQLLK